MLYRINHKNFLLHAIDWLPLEQLYQFQYAVISVRLPNGGRAPNVGRLPFLWPISDATVAWETTQDREAMREIFLAHLRTDDPELHRDIENQVYQALLNPIDRHVDVLLYCHEDEDPIMDVICEFLEKDYHLKAIDLNQLFTTGHAGPYKIDLNKIHDKAVDVRRWASEDMKRAMASTYDGKMQVIAKMTKKEKRKKFDELAIDPKFIPKHLWDKVLLEEWDKADRED